jgi:hypothetical protein
MPDYLFFGVKKPRTLAASANPIAPEEEIDAVVQQVPDVQYQRKTISRRPAFRASAKFRRARFQFVFEKLRHTVAHFCREPKLLLPGIIIEMRF